MSLFSDDSEDLQDHYDGHFPLPEAYLEYVGYIKCTTENGLSPP
jgi:hypothetical protein